MTYGLLLFHSNYLTVNTTSRHFVYLFLFKYKILFLTLVVILLKS